MSLVSFGKKFEVYGNPSDVKTAYERIKNENAKRGIPTDFIDTSNSKNKRLDRVVITTEQDIADFKHALQRKEDGKKAASEYVEGCKTNGIDVLNPRIEDEDKYFGRMVNKDLKNGGLDWISFWNSLPGHTKTIVLDPLENITIKAQDALESLRQGTLDTLTGTVKK